MHTDVCIVGNGVIGKAAALGLAHAGYRVVLLGPLTAASDPADPADWDTRVYALNGATRELLERLKVWSALDPQRIAPVDGMAVCGDGARPGEINFDAYGAHADALSWIVEDSHLNRVLDVALRFAPNVQRISGRADSLSIDQQRASVALSDGQRIDASLIVGADGGHSWVRAQADIGLDYRPYEQRAVVSNFSCSLPHRGVARQWFAGADGVIALLPLPGKQVSLVWSAPDALADTLLRESAQQLAQRLSALPGQPLGDIQPLKPARIQAIPLSLMRAHQLSQSRLALVGDAAHVMHPLAGQGMNLGFADVSMLLQVLGTRDQAQDCGDTRLLARYARARKADVLLMLCATDGLERLFASQFEPLRLLRNVGLDLLNKLPGVKRRMMTHAAGK